MECFNNFWPRRLSAGDSPWIFGGKSPPTPPPYFRDIMENDLRQLLRQKAEKHREYYNSIVLNSNPPPQMAPPSANPSTTSNSSTPSYPSTSSNSSTASNPSTPGHSSVPSAPSSPTIPAVSSENSTQMPPTDRSSSNSSNPSELVVGSLGGAQMALEVRSVKQRVRRRGVYEFEGVAAASKPEFKSVKALRDKYLEKLEKLGSAENAREKPAERDGGFPWDLSERLDGLEKTEESEKSEKSGKLELLAPPPPSSGSGYASGCSDDEKEKISKSGGGGGGRRSGSSDSAVHSADEDGLISSNWGEKREEILPDDGYQPRSPYSPRCSVDHSNVPSKTLLEAHYVPLPIDRKFSVDIISEPASKSFDDSRRQSCFSEGEDQQPRYRYWRTPSVVVSDYSDDIMGLTLEDIEYIRESRDRSMSPDSSLHSSCSNLNYCGSSLSGLEGEYVMYRPYGRKNSNCSSCSTLSDEEEDGGLVKKEPSGWRKLRNIVQWTPFFQTYKKQRYPWVQLAGHQGNFKAGPDQGTILKKLCAKEEKCFKILMKDILRPYVPEYKGLVTSDDGECSYIQLQDLLGDFVSPCVMDCKIGVRTYLEEELAKAKEKPKLRKDMYEKMCQIDQSAPTEDEHKAKGVTKPRYMVWRETISSTATLGFRIEGIRNADGTSTKDFKTTKTKEQVMAAFERFTEGFPHAIPKYIQRLKAIKATLETSEFFGSHEVIGSSLLFVHDRFTANVWLIDFAKTISLPQNVRISHNSRWKVGNHEDGYLIGVDNLIRIFMTMLEQQPVTVSPPLALSDPLDVNVNKGADGET